MAIILPAVQPHTLKGELVRADPGDHGKPFTLPILFQGCWSCSGAEHGEEQKQACLFSAVRAEEMRIEFGDEIRRVESQKIPSLEVAGVCVTCTRWEDLALS
jgi:hypothetical protein